MKIRLDKVASATVNVPLQREIAVDTGCRVEMGTVCVVRALEEKRVYDRIELVSGRMAKISKGDIIAGVIGERRALQGFAGTIPEKVEKGDILNVLNIGGIIGRAVSYNRDYGQPLRVEFLGAAVKNKKALNIRDDALRISTSLDMKRKVPVIVLSGTCMNSGKTEAASKIIQEVTWKGYSICSAKVSGIAALKDILSMEDHGAPKVLSFLDFGYPSTVNSQDVPLIAKGALNRLSRYDPDGIIIELGDGIFGDYGVLEFFRDSEIKGIIDCNIVCALDPVGAWGIAEIMKQQAVPIHAVSGPVTDNIVGIDFIHRSLKLRGLNARSQPRELGEFVERMIRK